MQGIQKSSVYKTRSRRVSNKLDSSVKTKKNNSNFKFESAATDCSIEQTITKKISDNSPIPLEEVPKYQTSQNIIFPEPEDLDRSFSFQQINFIEEEEQTTIKDLMRDQLKYETPSRTDYLSDQQEVKPYMMHILYDWLIEVCNAFYFKRETFYLSQYYVQEFLNRKPNIKKEQLQLLGATSLLIAHKCEEIYPKRLSDFKLLTQDLYSEEEFEIMEVNILKALCFKMNPNTHLFWLNYYLMLWDDFIRERVPDMIFRDKSNDAYIRYREIVQLYDCCLMDYNYQSDMKLSAIGLIYIIMGRWLNQFSEDTKVIAQSSADMRQYVQSDSEYNELFEQFLLISNIYIGEEKRVQFYELYEIIADLTKYFVLDLDFAPPLALKGNNAQLIQELPLEEILAFQTHNPQTLTTLQELSKY